MSDTAIKEKVSAWAMPGIMFNEEVLKSLILNFDEGRILKSILQVYDIEKDRMFSGRRHRDILNALHMQRYLLRILKGDIPQENGESVKYSLAKIGMMTGCNHATVLHSCRTAENLIQTDKSYRAKYEAVLSMLPGYVFNLKKLY